MKRNRIGILVGALVGAGIGLGSACDGKAADAPGASVGVPGIPAPGPKRKKAIRAPKVASGGGKRTSGEPLRQIALGTMASCGITTSGKLECWGELSTGEVPDGTFRDVATTGARSCAIGDTGSLSCWDTRGPVRAPSGAFSKVWVDDSLRCGITGLGAIECWDEDGDVELRGDQEGPFVDLALLGHGVLALKADQTLTFLFEPTWGERKAPKGTFANVGGTRDDFLCGLSTEGRISCWGRRGSDALALEGEFLALASGDAFKPVSGGMPKRFSYACGIARADGSVSCASTSTEPTGIVDDVPAGSFAALSTFEGVLCGLRDDGTAACWGDSMYPLPM